MSATVEFTGVSKWFGDVVAVSDVTFSLGAGVTALLGPNGAGKSTILRMLAGLTRPSQGEVRVSGVDPARDPGAPARIGLAPQQEGLFDFQSAREFVQTAAALHRLAEPAAVASDALRRVGMDPDDTRRLRTYSKGMRQRVKLAQAIVHSPEVIVLDEPLNGLDPRGRGELITLFRGLAAEGRTVIVSSHVLEEVERIGSEIVVIARGRLAAQGDFRAIRALMDERPRRFRLRADDIRSLTARLISEHLCTGIDITADDTALLETDDVVTLRAAVAGAATASQTVLRELIPLDDDLESVFRYVVDER